MLLTAFVYYRVRCLLLFLLCCIGNGYLSSYNAEKKRTLYFKKNFCRLKIYLERTSKKDAGVLFYKKELISLYSVDVILSRINQIVKLQPR